MLHNYLPISYYMMIGILISENLLRTAGQSVLLIYVPTVILIPLYIIYSPFYVPEVLSFLGHVMKWNNRYLPNRILPFVQRKQFETRFFFSISIVNRKAFKKSQSLRYIGTYSFKCRLICRCGVWGYTQISTGT